MDSERETLIRRYAAGEVTWNALNRTGLDNYRDVLAALGQLGLRPPIASMEGPNVEVRNARAPSSARRWRNRSDPPARAAGD